MNKILETIKKENFYKRMVYSFAPIIYFEGCNYWYLDNPFMKKPGIKNFPKFLVIWDKSYEEWMSGDVQKINSNDDIDFIINESRKIIKKYKNDIIGLLNTNFEKISSDENCNALNLAEKICREVYYAYVFFIHEYFETEDNNLLKLLPKVRMELSDFVTDLNNIEDKIIDAAYYRFNKEIPWRAFIYADTAEIVDLLKNPDEEKIEEFKKIENRPIAYLFDGEKLSVIKGREKVDEIFKILEEKTKEHEKEYKKLKSIKGMAASGGKAKGKVVKISEFDYENVAKVLDGKGDFVLATPMTRPEFVPYLKNCKAIITDEGGITSHAAIVSRELKIPCIVGTKIATQVLKDGDLVEVDANEGIVRILESAAITKTVN